MSGFRIEFTEVTRIYPMPQSRSTKDDLYNLICQNCREQPATVLIQHKTKGVEYTFCDTCWEKIQKNNPDIHDYYTVHPIKP